MFADYRVDDIERKLQVMTIRPLDVMVTGVTGAGKSTTLNGLFSSDVAKVGNGVEPETMDLTSYSLHKLARFWDTPGLGDGVERDKVHRKKLVYTIDGSNYGWIDLVLIIIEGATRDMGSTYKLINDIIIPHFQRNRVLIAINQCDVAMKGRHWDSVYNRPDSTLKNFLDEQAESIQRRVYESTGVKIIKPVYYSGKYNYNVDKLMDLIIDNIPKCRRNLVT